MTFVKSSPGLAPLLVKVRSAIRQVAPGGNDILTGLVRVVRGRQRQIDSVASGSLRREN